MSSEKSYSWTQPICDGCWDLQNPTRPSPRRGEGEPEKCVYCNAPTRSGIYIRIDPVRANFPTLERG